MTNVLRAQKCAGGQRFEKHTRLNQTSDGLKLEAADSFNLLIDFAQLRNSIRRKRQTPHTFKILGTGVGPMRRLKRLPNSSPNFVLLARVRRVGNFLSRPVAERELRDGLAG